MTGDNNGVRKQAASKRAMALVSEALDLLDAHGTSPEAAAHLDLALQKLREVADQK